MMRITHLAHVPLAAITIAIAVPAQTDWTQLNPTTRPAARQNSALAFDQIRGVSVLFGGWDGTQRRNDTWEWNGTSWNQVITLNSPSPRDAIAMAYDSTRQVTVCTGGYVAPGQTWEYNGTDWTQITSANTHPLTTHCPMVFDIIRGVCVLFGRNNATSAFETWEWNGTNWTQAMTASAPGSAGNMAYDLIRMRTVHFGSNGATWEYDGTTWTMMSPATSPPGIGCGSDNMVYDLGRQVVVLFGGCNPPTGDTWEYDGVNWQQITTANVPGFPRQYPAMAYDTFRQRTVLFGGRLPAGPTVLVDDTWEYGPTGTPAVNTPYGTACGGLTLTGITRPVTGTNWNLALTNIPAAATIGAVLFGLTNPNQPLGASAPGCTQYSGDIGFRLLLLPIPTPAISLAIPNDPSYIGVDLSMQGGALVPNANALGVALSAGLRGTIGDV